MSKKTLRNILYSLFILVFLGLLLWSAIRERMGTAKTIINSNNPKLFEEIKEFLRPITLDPNGTLALQTPIHEEVILENISKELGIPTLSGLESDSAPIFNIWSHENFANEKKTLMLLGANYLLTNANADVRFLTSQPIAQNRDYKLYKTSNPSLYFELLTLKPYAAIVQNIKDRVKLNELWIGSYRTSDIPFLIYLESLDEVDPSSIAGLLYFKTSPTQKDLGLLSQLSERIHVISQHSVPGSEYFAPLSPQEITLQRIPNASGCVKLSESKIKRNSYQLQVLCERSSQAIFKKGYHTNWKALLGNGQHLKTQAITPFMNLISIPSGLQTVSVTYQKSWTESITAIITIITATSLLAILIRRKKGYT